jgi:hypothetical protein
MDCNSAEQFVSVLYDQEPVPRDALHHIMACDSCRVRLQDYARITTEMRLWAAERQSANAPLRPPALPDRHNWKFVLGRSVRVPTLVIAMVVTAFALVTAGWIRSAAQSKVVTWFWCEMKLPTGAQGGSRLSVGEPDTETVFSGDEGYGWRVEALSIEPGAVVLRLRIKHFKPYRDSDAVKKELESVPAREITYVPGQQLSIAIEGGGTALLTGRVYQDSGEHIDIKSAAALLPGPDEIVARTPVLIRDGKDLLAQAQSATQLRCGSPQCGFFLYVPGNGLFFFSTQPLPGGVQGMAHMSQIFFRESEHTYQLLAATPFTGGEQPRTIWVVHVNDYLPSQHPGGAKSQDALVALGQGDLAGMLTLSRPTVEQKP